MISFPCPGCGKPLKVKDELAGKQGKCPSCNQPARVPTVSAPVAEAAKGGNQEVARAGLSEADRTRYNQGPPDGLPRTPVEFTDFLVPPQQPDELGRLGGYRILKVLGAGGMGVVYQAEDPKLKRIVALKILLPGLAANAANRKRFLREAQSAAKVDHDNVVPIYQVGEDRGIPFVAMKELPGESLAARIKREGKLDLAEVLRIGRETALGLAAAQEQNLIHRDIKPANLWIEAKTGRVKILDFGLARACGQDSGLTPQGAIMGTPSYMAPEQAQSKPIDGRADLFSLGCVLYRLSTGKLPFKGADTISTLMAVATEHPKAPHKVDPNIPVGLSELILRLLAKNPEDRPASAKGLVDLIAALEKAPDPATPTPSEPAPRKTRDQPDSDPEKESPTEARDRPRRKKKPASATSAGLPLWLFAAAGGSGLLLILVVGSVFILRPWRGSSGGPDRQVQTTSPAGPGGQQVQKVDQEAVNRKAADWVLQNGGTVRVASLVGGTPTVPLREVANLPEQPFWVQTIHLEQKNIVDENLEHLAGLAGLEELHLAGNPVRGVGLTLLKGLTNLKRLDLADTQIQDANLRHLEIMPSLEVLDLLRTSVSDQSLKHLTALANLRELRLEGTKVEGTGLERLAGLKNLKEVWLTSTSVPEGTAKRLTSPSCQVFTDRTVVEQLVRMGAELGIGEAPSYRSASNEMIWIRPENGSPDKDLKKPLPPLPAGPLRISIVRLERPVANVGDALKLLGGLPHLKQLVIPFGQIGARIDLSPLRRNKDLLGLVLPASHVRDEDFEFLADLKDLQMLQFMPTLDKASYGDEGLKHLRGLTKLEGLSLPCAAITDNGMRYLRDLKRLEYLTLEGSQVSNEGLKELAGLQQLQTLYLGNTKVTDAGLEQLAGMQLQTLHLGNTKLTDTGAKRLAGMRHLSTLHLDGTAVTGVGLKYLADLPRLTQLYLSNTGVTDAGLKELAGLTQLSVLYLGKLMITDAGLQHLAGLKQLNLLDLNNTQITDAGLKELAGLKQLNLLDLNNTKITDVGLKELAGLKQLRSVDLGGTKVTEAGKQELKKAIPEIDFRQ